MKKLLMYLLPFLVGFNFVESCNNEQARVYIDYEQIGNFQTYKTDPSGSSTAPGTGYFHVLYKINRIKNTSSKAKTFVFTHNKVPAFTGGSYSGGSLSKPNLEKLLAGGLAYSITVKPGETKKNVGCIIKRVKADNPASYMNTSGLVNLAGQANNKQPITCKRAEGNNAVHIISNPATPARLQQLCGGVSP